MGEAGELDREIAREYPRKGKAKEKHHMEWVPEIDQLSPKTKAVLKSIFQNVFPKIREPGIKVPFRAVKQLCLFHFLFVPAIIKVIGSLISGRK